MSDEQHPAELRPGRVVRRQPGLPEAGRHHDQTGPVTVQPGPLEFGERFPLYWTGGWRRGRRLGYQAGCACGWGLRALSVVGEQRVGERPTARIGPEPLEGREERCAVLDSDGPF